MDGDASWVFGFNIRDFPDFPVGFPAKATKRKGTVKKSKPQCNYCSLHVDLCMFRGSQFGLAHVAFLSLAFHPKDLPPFASMTEHEYTVAISSDIQEGALRMCSATCLSHWSAFTRLCSTLQPPVGANKSCLTTFGPKPENTLHIAGTIGART